ncbi:MAG: ATP-binding cassette domain-containing protein [Bifidobacteriaceae bacterium]|jgi:phosphate transport system ATP-binding protein|nr:ATP-binding cassette domain-containing protein [Bifidobacteriaceae bacterium]
MAAAPTPTPLQARLPVDPNATGQLKLSRVNCYYGQHLAVADVSLEIPARAVTAFIGPSGCGKSTLLRAINRLHEVIPGARAEGLIALDGANLYDGVDPVAVRAKIGMVFQKANPFPAMSIKENVLAGLTIRGQRLKSGAADDLVEECLRRAHLWDEVKNWLRRPGGSLSGGQQQRLCIARAVAVEPDVLLMDEPCSALDPISTLAIEELMRDLARDYTVVVVTHNMAQAARVSDQTAFFSVEATGEPGRLIESGLTADLFSAPKVAATRDYIEGRFG